MKTSNKLISLGIAILIVGVAVFIVAAKSAMVPKVENVRNENDILNELKAKELIANSDIVKRDIGKLLSNKLKLDGNHRYILDPTSENVIVTGRSAYINEFKTITDSMLFDAPMYHEVTTKRDEKNDSKVYDRIDDVLYFEIGVKDKQDLVLLIGDQSKVTFSDLIDVSNLKIVMEGTSHIDGELRCENLELNTRKEGHARLKGIADKIDITAYGNSKLECGELVSSNVKILLSDNTRLSLKANNHLSGIIRNNAFYNNHGFVSGEKVLVMDNATFD